MICKILLYFSERIFRLFSGLTPQEDPESNVRYDWLTETYTIKDKKKFIEKLKKDSVELKEILREGIKSGKVGVIDDDDEPDQKKEY